MASPVINLVTRWLKNVYWDQAKVETYSLSYPNVSYQFLLHLSMLIGFPAFIITSSFLINSIMWSQPMVNAFVIYNSNSLTPSLIYTTGQISTFAFFSIHDILNILLKNHISLSSSFFNISLLISITYLSSGWTTRREIAYFMFACVDFSAFHKA